MTKRILFAAALLAVLVSSAAVLWVASRPAATTIAIPSSGDVLQVQSFTTAQGITVWLVEDHHVPVISLSFSFEGGLLYDPADKPGVGRMVSILLDEGAGELNSQNFQKALNDHAIQLRYTANRDAFEGQMVTLRKHKDKAFNLLRLSLTQPHFEEDAITRMKNSNMAEIKRSMEDPAWLSSRTFNGMVFEGHAYARPGYGNLHSIARITRQDLLDFAQKQFTQNTLHIAIAGDITLEEAKAMVEDVFGTLPAATATPEVPAATPQYAGKTILLPAQSAQTFITIAQQGIDRHSADWHTAVVMNHILGGGGFESRLMNEVRKKRGLTYGVYSDLNTMEHASLLRASLSVGNAKAAEALAVLKEEWQRMADHGVSAEELANAQSYLTGSLLLQLTSTTQIAGVLNGLQQEGLGPDYINTRNDALRAVTQEDVARLAKELLKTDQLTVILTGKPENVTADITLTSAPGMEP